MTDIHNSEYRLGCRVVNEALGECRAEMTDTLADKLATRIAKELAEQRLTNDKVLSEAAATVASANRSLGRAFIKVTILQAENDALKARIEDPLKQHIDTFAAVGVSLESLPDASATELTETVGAISLSYRVER